MISPITKQASPEVWAFGTLPPPVTGLTLLTEQVVRRLERRGSVKFCNWSPGNVPRGIRFRVRRVARFISSLVKLLAHGREPAGRLYVAANSQAGLWLTALLVRVGRRLGYEIYLHHHTYLHIDRVDRRMAWIDRCMGRDGAHIVHCAQMEADFRRQYDTQCRFVHLNPSIVAETRGEPRHAPAVPFRIGHLGNLSLAKGLDWVLDTISVLHRSGRDVRLTLAGPFHTKQAKQMAEAACQNHPGLIEYSGPLYGDAKAEFFQNIDCFLLPSRHESWGLVLIEAMGAGAPVVAFDQGCARTLVGEAAGTLIDRKAAFPELAAEQIGRWIDEPASYAASSQAACEQAARMRCQSVRQLDQFAEQLFRDTDSLFEMRSVAPADQALTQPQ